MGLKGEFDDVALGSAGEALDKDQEVELVIAQETDEKGNSRLKVQYVNKPGGASFKRLAPQEAKAKLRTLNVKGELAALRKDLGVSAPVKKAASQSPTVTSFDEDEDLNFL
jgi:hypothetical protein